MSAMGIGRLWEQSCPPAASVFMQRGEIPPNPVLGNSQRKRVRKQGRGSLHSLGLGPLRVRRKTGDVRPIFRIVFTLPGVPYPVPTTTKQQADVVYGFVDTGKPNATTPLDCTPSVTK